MKVRRGGLLEVFILVAIFFGALIAFHYRRFDNVVAIVFPIAVFAASARLIYVKARADVRDALIAGSSRPGTPGPKVPSFAL